MLLDFVLLQTSIISCATSFNKVMTWHLVVCVVVFMSETVERPKLFDADALSYLILYILHIRRNWTGGTTWQYIHISKQILSSSGSKGLLWSAMWQRQGLYVSKWRSKWSRRFLNKKRSNKKLGGSRVGVLYLLLLFEILFWAIKVCSGKEGHHVTSQCYSVNGNHVRPHKSIENRAFLAIHYWELLVVVSTRWGDWSRMELCLPSPKSSWVGSGAVPENGWMNYGENKQVPQTQVDKCEMPTILRRSAQERLRSQPQVCRGCFPEACVQLI